MTATALSVAAAGVALASSQPSGAAAAARGGRTSSVWAHLADQVPAPILHWTACRKTAQCATARLPLNYHHPHGAKMKVALLRIRAKDPRHRLGTVFVNPGGPGISARDYVFLVAQARPILDRFDIVGIDPRGVGGSTPIHCFRSKAEQARAERPFAATPFPGTRAQQRSWIRAASALGRACSTTARPIASAMSTTDDALDMDVLRRSVGDRKLTFFAQSGGSYLGLVYANMFPGRIRAVAIDGIVDPQAWAGTQATAGVPMFDRIGAAAASHRVLHELLVLCQRAGRSRCSFASANTPARYGRLASRLLARPLRLTAPGIKPTVITYANLVADTEHWMHDPSGYRGLFPELTDLARLAAPGGGGLRHAALVRDLLRLRRALQGPPIPLESLSGVACADGRHAARAASWPAAAAAADRRARYFGAFYAWLSVQCAHDTWTAHDTDVYRGPFDHRTSAPVLVVGARWDPATAYRNAVKVARLMPNSRLVSSDNWGHQSAGTSACADNAIFGYLIHPQAPAPKVTHCRGDVQPFASSASTR